MHDQQLRGELSDHEQHHGRQHQPALHSLEANAPVHHQNQYRQQPQPHHQRRGMKQICHG